MLQHEIEYPRHDRSIRCNSGGNISIWCMYEVTYTLVNLVSAEIKLAPI